MFLENVEPGSAEACHILESEKDEDMRKRCIKTFLYQLILYGSCVIVYLIVKLVKHSTKSPSQDTLRFFAYLSGGSGIVLCLLMILGFLLAAKGAARALGFPLMIAATVFALLVFLGANFVLLEHEALDWLFYSILPFVLISLGNLVWAVFIVRFPFHIVLAVLLVVTAIVVVTLIHVFTSYAQHSMAVKVFLGILDALGFMLQLACWVSAARYSLRLR